MLVVQLGQSCDNKGDIPRIMSGPFSENLADRRSIEKHLKTIIIEDLLSIGGLCMETSVVSAHRHYLHVNCFIAAGCFGKSLFNPKSKIKFYNRRFLKNDLL